MQQESETKEQRTAKNLKEVNRLLDSLYPESILHFLQRREIKSPKENLFRFSKKKEIKNQNPREKILDTYGHARAYTAHTELNLKRKSEKKFTKEKFSEFNPKYKRFCRIKKESHRNIRFYYNELRYLARVKTQGYRFCDLISDIPELVNNVCDSLIDNVRRVSKLMRQYRRCIRQNRIKIQLVDQKIKNSGVPLLSSSSEGSSCSENDDDRLILSDDDNSISSSNEQGDITSSDSVSSVSPPLRYEVSSPSRTPSSSSSELV